MSFHPEIYKLLNPDLTNKLRTPKDYYRHYILYGKAEGRHINISNLYPDFNHTIYRNNYSELHRLNNIDLELHYLQYGKKEGRVYDIDISKKRIYIVTNISVGGTSKYVKDLITNSNNVDVIIIDNRQKLYSYIYNNKDYIMIQQLINTNISPLHLIEIKNKYSCKMIITVHDFSWFNRNVNTMIRFCPHRMYLYNVNILKLVKDLFSIVDMVIHPTRFTYDEYSKRLDNSNFRIVPHIDKGIVHRLYIPIVTNVINIGILHPISIYKGSEYVNYLMNNYKSYKNIMIKYYAVDITLPKYKEEQFSDLLVRYNIHGMLLLNKWGETWSYLLTKSLNSGLSILYNNIGAYKYRIEEKENRFIVGNTDNNIDINNLRDGYERMLEYLVENGREGKRQWLKGEELVIDNIYREILNTV
jgi:hypothetical protein